MKRFLYLIFLNSAMVSVFAGSCTTSRDGKYKPILANPELAIPTAIANKVTGRDRIYVIKGEVSQDQKCFRPYPMSRLKVRVRRASGEDALSNEAIFYINDRRFEKELTLDSSQPYLVQLIYEPTNSILAEQRVMVSDPLNVLLKIKCES